MEQLIPFLLYGVLPIVFSVGAFFMKSVFSRLDAVEKALPEKLEESDVRQLLADKIDPVREDIKELRQKLEVIMEILLRR